MIRRIWLSMLLAFALVACETTAGDPNAGTTSGVSRGELRNKSAVRFRQLDAINALRTDRGLVPLQYSQALNSAALTHARDMALQQRAWHFGTDRSNPQSRAVRAGFSGTVVGENIAESFDSDLETLQNWLNSRNGADVVLNPRATSIGFAWFQESSGKVWWVQTVGRPGQPGT